MQFTKNLPAGMYQVVLVDRNNYHCFQPLLYQVATSGLDPASIAFPLRKTLRNKDEFYFRIAEVEEVLSDQNTIRTSTGDLTYDYLVLATGSATNFFGNDKLEQNGMAMKNIPEALNIRSLLLQNFEKALLTDDLKEREALMNVVIVGGGPTGVELAGAIAELKRHVLPSDYPDLDFRRMRIQLLEAGEALLAGMNKASSSKALRYLRDIGVEVWLKTAVEAYDGKAINTNTKTLPARTMIWAAGVHCKPPKGLDAEALVKNQRIAVDEFNRVKNYENVFAVGDAACMKSDAFPNGHPMVAQPAIQQAKNLAKNFVREYKEKEWKPFKYRDLGSMATIGRRKAVAEIIGLKMQGAFAWLVWLFVHLMALVGFRNRLVVFVNWSYNFINYNRDIRLIIRPFEPTTSNGEHNDKFENSAAAEVKAE